MTFDQLTEIMIKLYGRDWIGSLSIEIQKSRDTIRKWRKQGVPKWFLVELPVIIESRRNAIDQAEDMALNAIADARKNQQRIRLSIEDL